MATNNEGKISNIDLAEEATEGKAQPQDELANSISDERREEITKEVEKLEDEINTLKQALQRKETQLTTLRTELGITRWSRLQNSQALNKSKQALAGAGQKTSVAFKTLGSATATKWTEIKESEKMQSVSEKFWATTGAVKNKLFLGSVATRQAITGATSTASSL